VLLLTWVPGLGIICVFDFGWKDFDYEDGAINSEEEEEEDSQSLACMYNSESYKDKDLSFFHFSSHPEGSLVIAKKEKIYI